MTKLKLSLILLLSLVFSLVQAQNTFTVYVGVSSSSVDPSYNTSILFNGALLPSSLPAWHFHNFYPNTLTANVGDIIVFKFNTNIRHSVTHLTSNQAPSLRSSTTTAYDPMAFAVLGNPLLNFTGVSCSSGYMTQSELVAATGGNTYTIQLDNSLSTATPYYFYDVFAPKIMSFTLNVQAAGTALPSDPATVDTAAQTLMSDHLAQATAQDAALKLNPFTFGTPFVVNEDRTKTWTIQCGNANALYSINGVYLRFYPSTLTISLGDWVKFVQSSNLTIQYAAHHNVVFNGSTTDSIINWPSPNTVKTAYNPNAVFDGPDNVISSTSRTYRTVHRYPFMGAPATSSLSGVYYGRSAIASGYPSSTLTSSYSLQFATPGTYPFISVLYAHFGMSGMINVLNSWTAPSTSPREYRSLSGFGNNQLYPILGQTGTMTQRYGRSYFAGSPSSTAFRTALSGNPLPAGRNISNYMFSKSYKLNHRSTSDMNTYYGMFLTSDTAAVGYRGVGPSTTAFNNPVPSKDPWFDPSGTGTATLTFSRLSGMPGTGTHQVDDPLHYSNSNSQFLDMSGVYGMTKQTPPSSGTVLSNTQSASSIRTFVGGHLCLDCLYTASRPFVPDQGKLAPGGDQRINKTPATFSIAMVWRLEHNRLADEFAAANPTWDDERLYQEARRMNIAFYQKITTREYLATLVGFPLPPYTGYNASQDPSIFIEYAVAAARYGHAEVLESIWRRTSTGESIEDGDLTAAQCMFRTQPVIAAGNPGIEPILWGLMAQKQGRSSVRFNDVVRNMPAFGGSVVTSSPIQDLLATNLARGRDQGLPSYVAMRDIMGLPAITSFSQISSDSSIVADLQALYERVEDIDLFVGGLAEDEVHGANVGSLFSAMIRKQFQALRDGDRFWFENPDYFTANETAAVYATNFSMILARNTLVLGEKTNQISDLLPANPFFTLASDLRYIAAHNNKVTNPNSAYTNSLQLHSLYLLSWSIISSDVGYRDTISMELRVKNSGWVGIGFDPQPNTMKGADIVLAYWLNGQAVIVDSYARDVGLPTPDSTIGGVDDVYDRVAFNETVGGVTVQVFQFKRKLITGDVWDKELKPGNLHLIWAFHPDSFSPIYHGPSRSAAQYVNLHQLPLSSITLQEDSKAVMIAIAVISGILIAFPLIIIALVIVRRNDVRIRAATFVFCILIPVGAIFAYVAVIMANLDKSVETCMLYYWFGSAAYVLVFGSILSKTWRITRIFHTTSPERKLQKVIITTTTLVMYLVGLLLAECILLAVWHGTDPMSPRYVIPDNNSSVANLTCVSNSDVFIWIWIIMKLILLIVGSYLSYSVRGVENALFNESAGLSQSIYVSTVVGAVCLIFGFSLRSQQNTSIIIQSVGLIFPFSYTLFSQFVPKFDDSRSAEKAYTIATQMQGSTLGANASVMGHPRGGHASTLSPPDQHRGLNASTSPQAATKSLAPSRPSADGSKANTITPHHSNANANAISNINNNTLNVVNEDQPK